MAENDPTFASQTEKAKSDIVSQITRIVRKAGLDYEAWRYISKQVRKECDLRPAKKGRRLPRVLTTEDFRRFYEMVDQAKDVQHTSNDIDTDRNSLAPVNRQPAHGNSLDCHRQTFAPCPSNAPDSLRNDFLRSAQQRASLNLNPVVSFLAAATVFPLSDDLWITKDKTVWLEQDESLWIVIQGAPWKLCDSSDWIVNDNTNWIVKDTTNWIVTDKTVWIVIQGSA